MTGIKYFNIHYDCDVYHPGQMVSGHIRLSLDRPMRVNGIEFTVSGEAKCQWTESESYRDSDSKLQWRDKSHDGSESYFNTKLTLLGGGSQCYLSTGDHVYPFSISLPAPLPPSYNGKYGHIGYYGEVKLNLPWALDKYERRPFLVDSPIDLNSLPKLSQRYDNEKSKTFCCWCCASGPLTFSVHLPRIGFDQADRIPITLDVDNASNVEVRSIIIELKQMIHWKATTDSKNEAITIKKFELDGVAEKASHTCTKELPLGPNKYPHSGNCSIISIKYELSVELVAKGAHCNLDMKIPITISSVPYKSSSQPESMGFGSTSQQVFPVGTTDFAPTCPPNLYGGQFDDNFTPSYPGGTAAPYSGGSAQPHPGASHASYTGGAGAPPYPRATGNTGDLYSGSTIPPYPGQIGAAQPNPAAMSTPNMYGPHSQPAYAPGTLQTQHMHPNKFLSPESQTADKNPLLQYSFN